MQLFDLIYRTLPPVAWAEGDNIPWHVPSFSQRMLEWHLRQDSDHASRPADKIDAQVAWIHSELLSDTPTRVLDLACGPGLYLSRLAKLGHEGHGIDFAPAAIAYAAEVAQQEKLACSYELADLRTVAMPGGFGLVMLISGQFNVFQRDEARSILARAFAALRPGGSLVLEPQRFDTVVGAGAPRSSWEAVPSGLFSPDPHLVLSERFWDPAARVSTERFFIVDAATGEVTRYAMSNEAYTDEEYAALLEGAGFDEIRILPSLIGVEDESQAAYLAVTARRPAR